MGFALWSPPLDKTGNSVRGVHFCQQLVEKFNFHNYDSLVHSDSQKIDPRRRKAESDGQRVVTVLFAAANGDLSSLKRYVLQGMDIELTDYDGRSALHLAASEGHTHVARFLIEQCGVRVNAQDRWGRTPLDDARHFGHADCAKLLELYQRRGHNGLVSGEHQRGEMLKEDSRESTFTDSDEVDLDLIKRASVSVAANALLLSGKQLEVESQDSARSCSSSGYGSVEPSSRAAMFDQRGLGEALSYNSRPPK